LPIIGPLVIDSINYMIQATLPGNLFITYSVRIIVEDILVSDSWNSKEESQELLAVGCTDERHTLNATFALKLTYFTSVTHNS